ncbi:MAG TPA: hypothetical protein VFQ85_12400 [Mycobacteriales bacterium]|jgi:hypothetical protein|nr:hypothetical protein [Mycobacteriales bacterium]
MPADSSLLVALVGVGAACAGGFVGQARAGRNAATDRVWERRAETYVDLLAWVEESFHQLGTSASAEPLPVPLRARLSAFGSDGVDNRLRRYLDERDACLDDPERSHERVETARHLLRLWVREELSARPSRVGRTVYGLVFTRSAFDRLSTYRARWLSRDAERRGRDGATLAE